MGSPLQDLSGGSSYTNCNRSKQGVGLIFETGQAEKSYLYWKRFQKEGQGKKKTSLLLMRLAGNEAGFSENDKCMGNLTLLF